MHPTILPYGYLGLDPGVGGGAAVIYHKDRVSAPIVGAAFSFKDKTDLEIFEFFKGLYSSPFAIQASRFEKVASSPQMGVSSSFTFGDRNGFLRGIITALAIPFEFISPLAWQINMKCKSGGKKSITRAKAQQLYAGQFPLKDGPARITDQIADALLIATYCSRVERGLA